MKTVQNWRIQRGFLRSQEEMKSVHLLREYVSDHVELLAEIWRVESPQGGLRWYKEDNFCIQEKSNPCYEMKNYVV